MNTRSRWPERGWRAVGRHGGLLPRKVVSSHFFGVRNKPVRIPRDRHAASNISPLFDAARQRVASMLGRPSSRHHSQAAERKAGQRRRALSGAAGAEPRAENRCLPIFEHGEHFDVPEHRGITQRTPGGATVLSTRMTSASQSRPKPRGGSMLMRSSRSSSTIRLSGSRWASMQVQQEVVAAQACRLTTTRCFDLTVSHAAGSLNKFQQMRWLRNGADLHSEFVALRCHARRRIGASILPDRSGRTGLCLRQIRQCLDGPDRNGRSRSD
jgi:hypothetical protein